MQCEYRSSEPMEILEKVKELISQLTQDSSIMEIWLIGSQASGNAHSKSDWDILVFSEKEPQVTFARAEGIDVLWKGPLGKILLEGQSTAFQMEFSEFNWVEVTEGQAIYCGKKFNEVPEGGRDTSMPLQSLVKCKAVRLWRRT